MGTGYQQMDHKYANSNSIFEIYIHELVYTVNSLYIELGDKKIHVTNFNYYYSLRNHRPVMSLEVELFEHCNIIPA